MIIRHCQVMSRSHVFQEKQIYFRPRTLRRGLILENMEVSSNRYRNIIRNAEEGPSSRHEASSHIDIVFKSSLLSRIGTSILKSV